MILAFGRELRREKRPGDLVLAGSTAPVNRLVATITWLCDDYAKVVTAFGTISGEINGHVSTSLTLLAVCLNLKSNRKLFEAFR